MSATKRKSTAKKSGARAPAARGSESERKTLAVAGRSKPGAHDAARSGVSKTSTSERSGKAGGVTGAADYPNAVYEDKRR